MQNLQENPGRWYNASNWTVNDIGSFFAFVAFYVLSFGWDACVIRAGYMSLTSVQSLKCVEANSYGALVSDVFVIAMIFMACAHSVLLIWIFGFLHSSKVSEDCLLSATNTLPDSWCHPSLCIPWTLWYLITVAMFAFCCLLFLFNIDIMDADSDAELSTNYRACGGEDLVESSNSWILLSLILFSFVAMFQCLYCALLRVITGDVSLILPGQQRVEQYNGDGGPESNRNRNPDRNRNRNRNRDRDRERERGRYVNRGRNENNNNNSNNRGSDGTKRSANFAPADAVTSGMDMREAEAEEEDSDDDDDEPIDSDPDIETSEDMKEEEEEADTYDEDS